MSLLGDRGYPLVLAKNFTKVGDWSPRPITLVVLHSMEAPEKPSTAENVAAWFAGPNAPQASAHYSIDADSVIQCVLEKDVAWHAPGANRNGIGLEMAGYAGQKPNEWSDLFSMQVIMNTANITGAICLDYHIPMEYVDEKGLLAKKPGITTHAAVSRAFKQSTHWDPGPNFPMDLFLNLVRNGAIAT